MLGFGWGVYGRGIKNLVTDMLILKCLLHIQVEMSSRQLAVCIWCSGLETESGSNLDIKVVFKFIEMD